VFYKLFAPLEKPCFKNTTLKTLITRKTINIKTNTLKTKYPYFLFFFFHLPYFLSFFFYFLLLYLLACRTRDTKEKKRVREEETYPMKVAGPRVRRQRKDSSLLCCWPWRIKGRGKWELLVKREVEGNKRVSEKQRGMREIERETWREAEIRTDVWCRLKE
jgi:hypothetical protein